MAHRTGAVRDARIWSGWWSTPRCRPKAIASRPTCALMHKAIVMLGRRAQARGAAAPVLRPGREAGGDDGRPLRPRQPVQAHDRQIKFLRTRLGRLIRDIRRKIAARRRSREAFAVPLCTRRPDPRPEAAPTRLEALFLHAPEIECIGKGKARAPYEFGVKVSLTTTNKRCKGGQFILHAKALPGNPYDGHTLAGQIGQVARLTGTSVARAYVDRGYRGHKVERDGLDITISHTRGITSPTIRHEMRRRSGIEPVIGHLKEDGHLERNHLAGADGDAINAILCAAGHNMRLLAGWMRCLFALLLAILQSRPQQNPAIINPQSPPNAETRKFTGDQLLSQKEIYMGNAG